MYKIRGKVRQGKDRGKKLGYPTTNIALHQEIPQGIYISQTTVNKKMYHSVSFVGNAKTFGEKEIHLETHIISFDKNIYGEMVSVRLIKKIRDNQKFNTVKELVIQMAKDVKISDEYFNNV